MYRYTRCSTGIIIVNKNVITRVNRCILKHNYFAPFLILCCVDRLVSLENTQLHRVSYSMVTQVLGGPEPRHGKMGQMTDSMNSTDIHLLI